jgi:hydroxyacylglutathione hydrolase
LSVQIQMIGTGSAFAKKYYNNNALVSCNGFTLLIDCGHTAPRALFELGIGLDQLDGILITHLHADHIGGLEEIGFQMKYVYHKKPKLYLPAALENNLWELSLRGGMENVFEELTQLSDFFDVALLRDGEPFTFQDGFNVEIIQTEHIPQKLNHSLFINERLFYSGDIRFNAKFLLEEVLGRRNCNYVLHDCQLSGPGVVHACLDELLTLPESAQSKIYLMHYGDRMESYIGYSGSMSFLKQQEIYTFETGFEQLEAHK